MTSLSFSLTSSNEEVEEAFKLAYSIFKNSTSIDQYKEFKLNLWQEDPSFALENIVIARDSGGLICGLVRLVPRRIFRGNKSFSVAGISSVCLAPSYQGKGLSAPLIEHALEHCRRRNFDFAFLFARRAADYFYTRYGFQGIASYSKLTIKRDDFGLTSKYYLGPPSKQFMSIYIEAYNRSYFNVYGRIYRDLKYWYFLIKKLKKNLFLKFETLYFNGNAVGYIVWSDSIVHEIALIGSIDPKELITFLSQYLPREQDRKCIKFEITPQHFFVKLMAGFDITMEIRECSYGGHMACILNAERLIEQELNMNPEKESRLALLKEKKYFSHGETCDILGVLSVSNSSLSSMSNTPFDISIVDQF